MKLDPIKRELVRNGLKAIADNMIVTVIRTSRSVVIKNNLDFSSAICDANGDLVVQGLALPVHLGSIMPALKGCLDYFGDDIHEGDILASNDPYAGGSHLPDIFMFKPVYKDGTRVAFMCLILHHTDMGGRVAGGNATDSTEIFQEGLRIPPSKIYERGTLNTTLYRIIEHNVRVPEKVLGDLRAQIASLNLADRETLNFLKDYDVGTFKSYMTDIIDYTERRTRAAIAALPDGEVEFDDWCDSDGVGDTPIKFHVKLTVKGDELAIDFTGTSPQSTGALNPNFPFTCSCAYAAIRTVMDLDMPNSSGFYRPITITAPEGSFVNPRFPAPFGARGLAGVRIRQAVLGALAKLLPDRIPACNGSSEFGVVFSGYEDEAHTRPFLLLEFHNLTGQGAFPDADGQDAGPWPLSNVANVPVEVIEAENPIQVEEYAFLPDTGGAGQYRGALGIVRQYRIMAPETTVQLRSDRQEFQPWGLFGGKGGVPGRTFFNPARDNERLPSKFIRRFTRGDVLRGELPGSGGYGDPFTRAPTAVQQDVCLGKVTLVHAREAYGVVIDPETMTVDEAATAEVRRTRLS